ncbi:MAG: pseudouridine synthase [bacterium]|nr:pseudouridine synthase [bacterium]
MKPRHSETQDEYPMRINKYLAHKGYSTRRGADDLIQKGFVLINGRRAVLGDKVGERDKVEVRQVGKMKEHLYFAYHKPLGIITHSPQEGEEDISEAIREKGAPNDIFPIGRLDKNSSGLIILTNDGRITDRLLNPEKTHEKEYIVRTKEKIRPSFKEHMEAGIIIEGGYKTKQCKIEIQGEKEFRITLTEGKKHQIRRMCVALHNDVMGLKRVRIMNIKLGDLAPGALRPIKGEELSRLLKALGL